MNRSLLLTAAVIMGASTTPASAETETRGVVFASAAPVVQSKQPSSQDPSKNGANGVTFTAGTAQSQTTPSNTWVLNSGEPIDKQLAEWAARAGWAFDWKPAHAWIVPARTEYTGAFDEVIEKVFGELYSQGAPVKLNLWEGNRPPFAEIIDADIK